MTSLIPIAITEALESTYGDIRHFSQAQGGCINHGGSVSTAKDELFIKWNSRNRFPGMFRAEANGLRHLREDGSLRVPVVRDVFETEDYQVLLLELISEKKKSKNYWSHLGKGLATLHGRTDSTFGLNYDNYIGSLPQYNDRTETLVSFYIHKRFTPQIALANRSGFLSAQDNKMFESLFSRLNEILPERKPALLHGDLWSGNIMTDENGEPVLIDPAIHYGAPEADLAMTQLFGGFEKSFYESYFEEAGKQPGYEERIAIYQLYPLLVHVNLFGRSYVGQVRDILSRFA